ncbi:MAG: protease modulator HflC [Pseudomonadota bacterium]|jgi:membrane protease subunit HflC
MNTDKSTLVLIAVGFFVLMGFSSMFVVHQTQYALKVRLGKVVSADFQAGLNFKIPLFEQIRYFDNRIQNLDAPAERFLTSEKKNLIVDSYIKWRIINPEQYFISVGGIDKIANQRLSEIIADGLRSKFASRTIQEVVSGDRASIMVDITEEANKRGKSLGIEVVDVRIKRIELPPEVSQSVHRRMEAERERVARELRSRGEAEAVRIRADADRQRVVLQAEAQRKADEIRGLGEAQATDIYAQTFSQDPEFFALYRSLNAYKKTFGHKNDLLVIEPNSDFFKYFKTPIQTVSPNISTQTLPQPLTALPVQ